MKLADRMQTIKPYFFAKVGVQIATMRSEGRDVIRLDIGSPDMPPAPFIIEALQQAAGEPDRHGYTPHGGTPGFRSAVASYYTKRFGVDLDPSSEILGLIGSKEGIFHLSMAFLEPGDVALVPDPSYAVYTEAARFAGADVVSMPLLEKNGFLPDLSSITADARTRGKILWVNYPNNPTGALASDMFFAKLIDFAQEHQILVCHDAPYLDVTFDGYQAPSLLQISGAIESAIEFNSLSKTYNMGGWRLGMACGHPPAIAALHALKSNVDSGQFEAVLDAGMAALTGDQTWFAERNSVYQERRDIVLTGLSRAGLSAHKPKAAMYVWARGHQELKSEDFASKLLEDVGVSVTPGSFFGEWGEGYFRIALGTKTSRIREAMDRIEGWVSKGTN